MITIGQQHSGAPLLLSQEARRRHVYMLGRTGTGKSTLLAALMAQDIAAGRGFALIDPHGDLAERVADHIPGRAIYLDPLDDPLGFNPLQQVPESTRALAAAEIVGAMKAIWRDSWGPRMEYILLCSVRLLLDVPGATLLHLPRLLTDDRFRVACLKRASDPFVRFFWEREFAGYSERFRNEAIAPVQNKVGAFAANPHLRAILGQSSSTILFDRIMNGGQVFIANLSKRMGTEPAHLLGALLTTAILQAAERRQTIPESDRRDFTLYVDEFQNFATDSFAVILSEARKWRLNLCLANQFLGQLPDALRLAVLGNVGTLVVFRVGGEDAEPLAREFDLHNPATLTDTANYHAWLRMVRDGTPTSPIAMQTIPPQWDTGGRLPAIHAWTRANYARPREKVEKAIRNIFG